VLGVGWVLNCSGQWNDVAIWICSQAAWVMMWLAGGTGMTTGGEIYSC